MESRLLFLLLRRTLTAGLAVALLGGPALAEDEQDAEREPAIIEPEIEPREIREPRIDNENFEFGAYAGVMSVEDFGVNPVYGGRFAYHITEGLFVEATYGQTETDRTSFEVLSGAVELLMDEDRTLSYYNLSFGYNILPGEVFLGKSRAFNSALYIAAGAGNTEFAGDENFTVTVGMGYRLLAQDWLALHLGVRDHMFDSDLLGEEKTTHNIESFLSLTFFF